MLEKYQRLIEKLKNSEKKIVSLSFVESLFEMEDTNKFLKFNATTNEQIQRVEKFENQMENIKKKLYISHFCTLENV